MASHDEREDEQLAAAALARQKAGGKPHARELAALKRVRERKEEAERWRYYTTVPKKHYLSLCGRQHKVVDEVAARYGAPLFGATIDLGRVLTWFHDFLAENGAKLLREVGKDNLLDGNVADSPALERLRDETFKLKRLERLEQEKKLLPREFVHEGLIRIASRLRNCGEQLQRQYGHDALAILSEALDDAGREISQLFAGEELDLYGTMEEETTGEEEDDKNA